MAAIYRTIIAINKVKIDKIYCIPLSNIYMPTAARTRHPPSSVQCDTNAIVVLISIQDRVLGQTQLSATQHECLFLNGQCKLDRVSACRGVGQSYGLAQAEHAVARVYGVVLRRNDQSRHECPRGNA